MAGKEPCRRYREISADVDAFYLQYTPGSRTFTSEEMDNIPDWFDTLLATPNELVGSVFWHACGLLVRRVPGGLGIEEMPPHSYVTRSSNGCIHVYTTDDFHTKFENIP